MNTNCLEGWKCPECGYEHDFKIYGAVTHHDEIYLTDDGVESIGGGNTEWADDAVAVCGGCGFTATVKDFETEIS